MITSEKSIIINRSASEVFAYVSDQTNAPRWQRGLHEVRRTTDGPMGVGTRHSFVRTLMGRRMEGTNEYTRYEPDTLVAFKATSGGWPLEASYIVEPAGADHARVISRIDMQAEGVFRFAEGLIAAGLRRDVAASLRVLKDLLEAPEQEHVIRGS